VCSMIRGRGGSNNREQLSPREGKDLAHAAKKRMRQGG
jgi:hypothetical protein